MTVRRSARRSAPPRALLDVNVLVALAWPNHVHHEAVLDWLGPPGRVPFATCPVTQSGFIRVSSNARVIPEARTPREAREVLRQLTSLAGHAFWQDDIQLTEDTRLAWERIGSHARVTDAHLVALALRHGGRLATLDRAVVYLVPSGAGSGAVFLVPA